MKNSIFRMLRTCIAMMLVVVMLVSSVASAATLTLPKAIKTISEEAFMGDTSVENVVIPNGATSIGARAFKGCTNLKTVQIPDSVQSIGVDAFDGCDGVTIICSSTSEAAKYAADYDYIEVQYTDVVVPDPEPEFDVEWTQYIDTMYADSVWAGGTVLYANVAGYDAERDGEIEWELKLKSGESIPFIYNYSPEDQPDQYYVKHMYAAGSNYTGSATYELTVKVGEYTEMHEFTVTVTANSGDLPAGIASSNQYYEVGQTMRFVIGDLYFVNEDGSEYTGISMNDSNVYMDNSGIENYSIWEQGVEWINGEHEGFQVTFTKEGRYEVPVSVHVGNIIYVDSIWITVGSGLPSDDQFVKGACYDTLYVGYDATGNFAAATWFDEFVLYDGESIEWDVQVKEANPDTPVVNVELRETNNGMNAQLFFVGTPSEAGEVTYTVTAVVTIGDSEKAYSNDFKFYVEELPEDAPTNENVSVPKTEYNVMVGEELSFSDADIQLVGAPEGVEWTYEYIKHVESSWMEDETVCTWYEYNEWDGYYITFLKPGTYTLRAEAKINANYSVYKDITIYVRDVAESELDVEWTQYIDTMYIGGNGWMGNLIVRAELSGYDAEQHGEIVWNVECLEGVDVFTHWTVSPEGEENTYQMRLEKALKVGTAKYRMSVTVGDFTDSYEFTVNVIEAPADLPGGFGVAPQEYDVGDTMEFTIDDLTLLNEDGSAYTGSVKLTDANVHMELFDSSEYAFWNESAEFINGFRGGVKVTFDKAGRYLMPVTLHVCNYIFYVDVIVYVGDGVPSDAYISRYYMYDTLYADTTSEGWLGNAYLDDYPLVSGETVEWSIAANTANPVVIVELGDTWEGDERGIDLFYSGMTGETGNVTYTVTATVKSGDEIIKSYTVDYLVKVVAKPDTLPTDANVAVSKTKYDISLEDTLTFRYDDIQLVNAPEGVEWTWTAEYDGGEWLEGDACLYGYLEDSDNDGREDGIEINFVKEGRYVLKAVANISANYRVYKDIVICVGSSLSEDVYVGSSVHTNTVFNDTDDAWFCNVNLNNFQLAQGEEVKWEIVSKENKGLVELYVNDTWDNTIYANLYVHNVSGELGNETFTVTANVGGYSISTELTVEVIERPDELPDDGAVIVDLDKYEYEVGEEFKFDFDQISIDESVLPEEMKGKWSTDIWDTEQFDWYETGIQTKFEQAGIYSFKAVVRLASDYEISKMVYITVGDVQPVDHWNDNSTYMYAEEADEDGNYGTDLWITDVQVTGYVAPEGVDLKWEAVRTDDGNASIEIELMPGGEPNDYWCGFHAHQNGDTTGESTWKFIATAGDEVIVEKDYTITLLERDENLHIEIDIETDEYYTNVGEKFVFSCDAEYGITEDSVIREGAIVRKEIIGGTEIAEIEGFEWHDCMAGFDVVFDKPGDYVFTITAYFDNVGDQRDIYVHVIGGEPVVEWVDNSTVMHAVEADENGNYPEIDLWVADVNLSNYVAPEGVELVWKAERKSGVDSLNVEAWSWGGPNGYSCGFHAFQIGEQAGNSTWVFTATAGEDVIVSKEYTITLLERDESLNIGIDIDKVEFDVLAGEEFEFTIDNYDITEDSKIREGAEVRKEIYKEWNDSVEFLADYENCSGFKVIFTEAGDYEFSIVAFFDNIIAEKVITVHVDGSMWIRSNVTDPSAFVIDPEAAEGEGAWGLENEWIGEFELMNVGAGEEIEWSIASKDNAGIIELRLDAEDEYDSWVDLLASGACTTAGSETFVVTAKVGEEVITTEVTFVVYDNPEYMPTEEDMYFDIEETVYIERLEEFVISTKQVHLNNVPEGAYCNIIIFDNEDWLGDDKRVESSRWDGDEFHVIFKDPGVYRLRVAAVISANYYVEKAITIVVDDYTAFAPDVWVPFKTLYVDEADNNEGAWLADVRIPYFEATFGENAKVEWYADVIEFSGSEVEGAEPFMDVYCEEREPGFASLYCGGMNGQTGEVRVRVGCLVNDTYNYFMRIRFYAEERPEDPMFTDDDVSVEGYEDYEVYLYVNDEYTLNYNEIRLDNADEDTYWEPEIDYFEFGENEAYYEWREEGLYLKFHREGTYTIRALVKLGVNNYVGRDITIHVIDGEPVVEWFDHSTRLYAVPVNADGTYNSDLQVTDVMVSNYVLPDGEEFVWDIQYVSGVDSIKAYWWMNEEGPGRYTAGVGAGQIGEERGEAVWRLTGTVGDDVIVSREFTIELVDIDALDVTIESKQDEYYVRAGEEFTYSVDDFWIAEGSVYPEDAKITEFIEAEELFEYPGVEVDSYGYSAKSFRVTFTEAGTHTFQVVTYMDNFAWFKDITIHVDDRKWIKADISDPYAVVVDSKDSVAWALDNEWIGRFELMNVAEGEEIEWSVASKENKGIAVMALDYENAEGNSIDLLVSSECATVGTETFVVTAKVGEEVITEEFNFEVRNAPDYLPTVEDMYFFESGDTFCISLDDEFTISANDVHLNNVPEDMYCHIVGPNDEDWMYDGNVTERLEWVEDVLHIKFREPGVYQMNMIAVISSNYYVEKTITIIVRESENQEEFPLSTGVPFDTLYVYEDNDSKDEWLGDFSVQGYRFEEDTKLEWDAWIHDFSGNGEEGAEPFMDIYLYMQEHLNKGQMSVFCNGMNGNTGWVDVYVKCVVDDTYTFSTIIRYNAEELPEDPMFTNEDVYVDGYEDYTINLDVNEGYTLNYYEICLQNADDSVYWEPQIHDVGWDDDTAYVEWRDEGVYIEFYKEGTYKIKAVAKVEANCYLYREIKLVVGSGVSSDAYIDWGLNADRLFIDENASTENAIYFKDAYLVDSGVDEEDSTVTWSIESKNSEGFATLVMKQNSWDPCVFDNGIYVTGFNGEEGTETFIVTATVNGVEVSEEIEIQIMNMPEDMPTAADIRVSNDNYVVYVGDYFEFMDHNFGFDDGSIPEGMDYVFDIWNMEELLEKNEGEFHGNGISVTFTQAGEYSFDAMARFGGGYEIGKTINITVIDGLRANWYGTMYIHEGDTAYNSQLAYVWVDGFEKNYEEGATVTWDAKIVNYGDGEEPFMSVFVEECNSGDANLKCGGMTGKTGWVEVEITCTVNGTDTYKRVIGFNAEYVTDEMPTEENIWVESEDYYVNVGATFEYWAHKHGLDEGFGYQWESEIHGDGDPWAIEQMESFEWLEGNGFRVTFEEVGEYKFNAAVKIGANHWISRPITVHVMDLLTIRGTTMYEGKGDLWVADAYIFDYVNSEGANVEWSITPVLGEDQTECIELYFANEYDGEDTIYRMISATQIENATPVIDDYTFKIKAWAGKDVLINENVTVSLEEAITPTFDISVAQEIYDVGIGQEFFYSYANFGFTDDSQFPDGANKVKEVSIPDDMWETWVNNGFEWTYDENDIRSFRVAFKEAGTYTFTVTVLVNNWPISKKITLNVDDMSTVRWDDHADRMYKNSGDDMWVTDVYIENYYLDDEIVWTLEPAEDQENPCIELYFVESFSTNTRRGIHANQLTENTGSVTYNLTAVAADGSKVFINEDITVYLEDIPEDFVLNIWADSDIYNVAVGEEFVYTADKFGLDAENSNYPEGEHVSCEIWADDISNKYGRDFEWQDDGGFKVKFDQPGRYAFTVAVCVRNVYVTAPITIIVGDGPSLNAYVESDEVFADFEGDTWFGNVSFDNFFFSDGENIEWSCEHIPQNSGDTPVAELYVRDIWENGANINVCNLTGATGEATYKVTANCGNHSWEKEITVKVIARPEEELPGNDAITVPAELINLDVGTKFSYSLDNFSFDESTLPEGLKYMKLLWHSDIICNMESFSSDENGFSVTFNEEGRYEFDAVVKITADYIINKTVVIVVGDGIRGDAEPYIEEVCSFGPVYPGMGDSYYGCWELMGYDILNSDEVEWTVERYTDDYSPETPGVKMRVSWVSYDRYMADLNTYDVIEQYDTEEYDMICNVNGVEIARYRVYVTVAELTEDVPTDLWVNCDTYYVHAGDEFTFTYNEFGPNGNIPEGADVRYEAWVGDDLRNQASYIDLDNGFTLTPAAGEYVFTAACWIGNYAATRDITIVVYEGDWYFDWNDNGEDSVFEMYTNLGDMYIADAYIHAYDKPEGAEIEWTAEYKDEDGKVVDIKIDLRDDNHGARINASYANEDHSITGVDTYEIVAKAVTAEGETELGRHEVKIHVIEEPENMPTELWVDGGLEHHIAYGEEFRFTFERFGPSNGEVPDVAIRPEIYVDENLASHENLKWLDEGGFCVTPEPGEYDIYLEYWIGNYGLFENLKLVVHDEPFIREVCEYGPVYYCGEGTDNYYGCWELSGYEIKDVDAVEWTVEYCAEESDYATSGVEMYVSWTSSDKYAADLSSKNVTKQYGNYAYDLICSENGEEIARYRVQVTVAELTEDVPTDLWVNCDKYFVHAGDEFTFTYNEFGPKGNIPEGADVRYEAWVDNDLRNQAGYKELDNGFTLTPASGEYVFTAACWIGNYAATRDITIVVYEGDWYVDWNDNGEDSVFEMYPNLGDMNIVDAYIHGYDKPEGAEILWTAEYKDEDAKVVDIKINLNNDNHGAIIYASYANEDHSITGVDTYEIVAKAVIGETETELGRHEVKIHVIEEPENMPTELWVNGDEHIWHAGDWFTFTINDFELANGEVPAGAATRKEIWTNDDLRGQNGFEEFDGGFKVCVQNDGTYIFTAVYVINNRYVTRDISLVVFSGDYYFDWDDNGDDSIFEMYTNHGDMYIADAYLYGYDKPEGAEIVWTAEYKDEDGKVVDIRIDLRDDKHGASINASYANEDHSITGVDTYEIVAKAVIGETETELGRHEVTINLIEEPENMPTELWVNGDKHIWHAGDWFTFTINDFELANGEVPAGAATRKEIWINDDLRGQNGFEEFDGGFKVCVQNDGTYIFTAVYVINNRYITRDISLVVFSGDYYFDWDDNGDDSIFEMYTNHGDMYIADAYLYGYDKPEGAEIVWTAEYKDEDGKVVDIRIDLRDDNHGASINASYASEDNSITGVDTYEIVAKAVIGETETELGRHEVTINLIEEPENMPTELWVNGDEHIWHAGDWFTFTINDFELANGEVPAGAATRKEIWTNDDLRGQNGFEEFDGGFKVCVQNDGTYIFQAVYVINNRYITRDISLVVFSGDYYFDWDDNGDDSIFEMYTNHGDMYIADAYLYGYDKPEGAEIIWTAEYKDEDGKVVDIRIDLRDDNHGASINASYANEDHSITGVDIYEIVAKAVIGETETELGRHEVTIYLIEEPENMPTELWVEGDTYYWRNGDWFTFTTEMFDLNNGEVPAGAATRKEIWTNDDLRGQNGFEEFDGGFKVCVQNDGTYTFTAVYVINNRYITRDISLVVFSGDKYIRWNDHTDAVTEDDTFEMYLNGNGQMWVTDCYIIVYEKPENTDIEWYLEFKEGSVDGDADAQVVKLYINSIWNENFDCQINAERLLDKSGWAQYDIVAKAGETELVRRTVTINVVEIAADMPANEERIQIETNEYYLNVGQSFDYHVDKIGLDYAGDREWYPEIHIEAIEQIESFKWTDNGKGFSVTFDEEGEYKFFAAVRFGGNYYLRKEITITVMEKFDVISTTMYNGVGDLWVADAYIFDYALPENTVSEWSMEPVLAEGETECPLELYFESEYDGWYVYRMITATQKEGFEQINGVYTFEIKAWVGEDVLLEETVTVNLVDPATLTFDVKADAYEYTVGVGEEFRYSYNSFGFSDDTVIPDGASKIKQVQCSEELWNIDSFEWTLDEAGTRGFKVTFDEPGEYTFDVVMRINNWPKSKTVTINVTPYGYASVNWYDNGDTLYAIEGNTHGIGAAYLENYYIEEGDSISWSVNVTEGSNLCNVVIPEDNEYWDDGRGVNLHFTDFTGEIGTLKFTLTVTTDAGFTESHEFVYEVVAKPETLPTGIDVGQTEYNIEPGDSITIELKNLEYTGGNVPEEGFWNYSYVDANGNDMSWDDEQKKAVLTFHNEGRYWFKVSANINNYQLEQVITVNVGITEQNYTVDYYQAFTQLYAGVTPVNDYGCWGGNMQIMNYQVLPDETLTWSLTETYRDEGVTAELFFDVEDLSKNSLANIECRNVGTGIGKVSYEVEVVSSKGFTATRTFEFTVVANPGNLPKTLTVPFESYTVPAGSLITIRYDKFSVDGEKPEDFRYSIEGVGELPFEGRFAGDDITTPHRLHLKPEGTGTYTIRAQAICGNYVIDKEISITVTGYTQKYQDSEKLFIGDSEYLDDDFWAGLVSMVDYELQDGEEILWNVCRISGDENVELDLYMVEGNEPEIMNVYCNNVGAATGKVKYEVTGASNMGYSVSYEFDFSVENLPEGLPTELYVPNTTYELKANEVCEIWYKDFSVNAEMPEGAHFYIDVTNLPDTKYYAGQGDEERLYMEPNAAGTYVIEAQMIYGNYVIGTPITIIVTE